MLDNVQAIIGHLTRLRRQAVRLLQPGLSPEEIEQREAPLPFRLSPDLVALYRFKNGTAVKRGAAIDELWFFPGYYWLSLEEAASECRRRQRSTQWKKSWFPVFGDGAGGYYVVSCDPADAPGVIGFINGEPEQDVEYRSLPAMFETLAACFDGGAFFVKKKKFDIDDDKHLRIAIKLNPGLDFWTREEEAEEERRRRDEANELAKEATKALKALSPKQRRAREAIFSPKVRVALAQSSGAGFKAFLASDPDSFREATEREPPARDGGLAKGLLELAERVAEHVITSPAGRTEVRARQLALASVALEAASLHGASGKDLADRRLVVYALAGRLDECVPLLRVEGFTSHTTFAVGTALAQASLSSHRELLEACVQQAKIHPELVANPITLANVLSNLLTGDRSAEAAALARAHLKHDRGMTPVLYINAVFAFARADATDKTAQQLTRRMEELLRRDDGKYFRNEGPRTGDLRGAAHAALGLWYARKHDVASLLRHFGRARALKYADLSLQKNHPALLGLADRPEVKAFFNAETDAALVTKHRQIRANDRDWYAVFSRGLLLHERGEIEKAVIDYQRTIELNPSYPDVYVNMGNIYWTRDKNFAEAVRWYDKAIDRAENHLLARLNRAEARLILGDATGALVDAQRGIAIEKKDPRAHFLAALAYLALAQPGAARKAAKAGMALDRDIGAIDRDDWKARLRSLFLHGGKR